MIPTPEQAAKRLNQILRRGSVNLGEGPGTERLMLMLAAHAGSAAGTAGRQDGG